MKEYIEKILHRDVLIEPYRDVERLPLSYRSGYELSRMTIGGQGALVAVPVEKTPLATLRKQQHQMEIYTGLPCVLYLRDMNYYSRDAMLKEGMPFVWEGHQIYLPFMGTLLDDNPRQAAAAGGQISYLTQKLLLTALYQNWQRVTVTKAAEILDVSKMSITRCFDELEAMSIPYLTVRSRARNLSADKDKKAMWEALRPVMRNPVITAYALKEIPPVVLPMSGAMALAHYSSLDESGYPIYAITKKELGKINVSGRCLVPTGEIPGCLIQEMGYHISFGDGLAVDPLTTALSISEEEIADSRVSIAIDEMLEEHVW